MEVAASRSSVDDHHPSDDRSSTERSLPHSNKVFCDWGGSKSGQRQIDNEDAPVSRKVLDAQFAVVQLDRPAADREAKPKAGAVRRFLRERLEHIFHQAMW
jgi:hypothetical protein